MYNFLDEITDDYIDCSMDFAQEIDTCEEEDFRSKYIAQMLKENDYHNMECDFNAAVSAVQRRGFQDGFKACMRLMSECLNPVQQNT